MQKYDIINPTFEDHNEKKEECKMAILTANCKRTFVVDDKKVLYFSQKKVTKKQQQDMDKIVSQISKKIKVDNNINV